MKLALNEAACTGHGLCYAHAPELFADDDQGYGHVIDGGAVPDEKQQQARETLRMCPEGAISTAD